jgi:uncharacterized spore protein YtfJ
MSYKTDEELAADQISKTINVMGLDKEAVGDAIAHDHRTLQSESMRVVVGFLSGMAENDREGRTDARNEGACKMATVALDALVEAGLIAEIRGVNRAALQYI